MMLNFYYRVFLILAFGSPGDWRRRGSVVYVLALEDTFLYYTSFSDVSEWSKTYKTCRPVFEERVGTLTPIKLESWSKTEKESNETKALHIFNNKPSFGYQLSYYFPRNKKCERDGQAEHRQCKIMKSLGLIQALVFDVERNDESRTSYSVNTKSQYVSILGAGDVTERVFTEAVFLGSPTGSTKYRSTHTIDGKSFPMEIYMYFEDPTFTGAYGATQLVVLVEESSKDNEQVKPLINTIHALRKREKIFVNATLDVAKLEKKFREKNDLVLDKKYYYQARQVKPTTGFWDHWFNEVSSERDRESKYYVAEYNFQRAKWLERKTEFLVDELHNVHEELMKLWYMFRIEAFNVEAKVRGFKNGAPCEPKGVTNAAGESFLSLVRELERAANALEAFDDQNEPDHLASEDVKKKRKIVIGDLRRTSQFLHECVDSKKNIEKGKVEEQFQNVFDSVIFNGKITPKRSEAATRVQKIVKKVADVFRVHGMESKITYPYEDSAISRLIIEEIEPNLKRRRKQEEAKRMLRIQSGMFTEAQAMEIENVERPTVKLSNRFQMSWLMPKSGGHYKYIGATPFPPCITVVNTIVFQNPISMSREQIRMLTDIPRLNVEKSTHRTPVWEHVKNTLPPLRLATRSLKITFNRKNHQFRRADGFHKSTLQIAKEKHRTRSESQVMSSINVPLISLLLLLTSCYSF